MTPVDDTTADANLRRWMGLVTASMGLFLCSLDMTVNVALPDITKSLGTDSQTVQWIIIFYVGSSTGLQLGLGNAADRYGLKRFYLIGLILYALAVLMIGLAPELSLVLTCRVLQAVGNSMIMVSAPALVTAIFPPEERGRALGVMTGLATLGMVAGAWGGGFLVDAYGWRSIFLARVPLGALTILLSVIALEESKSRERHTYDLRGAVALFVGLVSTILFLTLGGRQGWLKPWVLALLILAMLAFVTFKAVERSLDEPVFDLGLLRHKVIGPLMVAAYLMFLAIFVNWFILPFYVSDILNLDAKTLGFLLMLLPVVGAITAPLGGWLSDQISPAYLTTLALGVISGSLLGFTWLTAHSTVAVVMLRMIALGLGMGLFQAANATLIMSSVSSTQLGTGGALLAMSRSMGTVSSVALMGALFASRFTVHSIGHTQPDRFIESDEIQAFMLAFQDIYLIAAILAGIATLVSLTYWPWRTRDPAPTI